MAGLGTDVLTAVPKQSYFLYKQTSHLCHTFYFSTHDGVLEYRNFNRDIRRDARQGLERREPPPDRKA